MELFLTFGLVALSSYVVWLISSFIGGSVSLDEKLHIVPSGIKVASKRCKKCGVHPSPSDMVMLWGYNWESHDMCRDCRENQQRKALVFVVPKLKNIPTEALREWYIAADQRLYIRKAYMRAPFYTTVYIHDNGDRFWNWIDWSYTRKNHIGWDEFNKKFETWKIEEIPEVPEPSVYVAS